MMVRDELPTDIERLKDLALSLHQEASAKAAKVEEDQVKIEKLEHHIRVLERMVFGPKSEKRPVSSRDDQQLLFELPPTPEPPAPPVSKKKDARKGRRKEFPKHLPRTKSVFALPETEQVCDCGTRLQQIGKQLRRELERYETTYLHEMELLKYACPKCQAGVKVAEGPPKIIDKGILGPSFLSHVLVERFGRHMPYHRQEQKYQGEGLKISRQVLCNSAQRCAELLEPIYDQLHREQLASHYLQADETTSCLQDSTQGGPRKAYFWVFLDPGHSVLYDFTESRSRDGPNEFLKKFGSYLQVDAYSGYNEICGDGKAIRVGCFAHARRKFVEAEASDPEFAGEAIEWIRGIYALEKHAKENSFTAEQLHALRNERARPLLEDFHVWLENTETKVLPKSSMGEAIHYSLNQWATLIRYLDDPILEPDNNRAEQRLRHIAIGRKNWMIVGNPKAGKNNAILFSLVMTCRELDINPAHYLADVLVRINTESDIQKLTPAGWTAERESAEAQGAHA